MPVEAINVTPPVNPFTDETPLVNPLVPVEEIVITFPEYVIPILDPADSVMPAVNPFTEETTFPSIAPNTCKVDPAGIVDMLVNVAPAVLIPALNVVEELKLLLPVKVCVPARPANVVVKFGNVTVEVVERSETKNWVEVEPEYAICDD